jgi:hypothetical protein
MKRRGKTLISIMMLLFVLLLSISVAYAAIPERINYQGYLTNASGNPVNATVSMTFKIYTVASGGTALWTETQSSVSVNNGIYNVVLGLVVPLGSLPFDVPYFLGVTAGSDSEMTPRQALTSVAYALTADTALNVANNVVTSPMIQDGSVSSADVNFNYASSTSKGGPATDLACMGCVSQAELSFTPGDITEVNTPANSGLTGGAISGPVTLIADTSYLQRRVSGTCAPNSSIRVINQDGTIICDTDEIGSLTLPYSGVANSSGNAFSVTQTGSGSSIYGISSNSNYGSLGNSAYGVYGQSFNGTFGYVGGVLAGAYGQSALGPSGYLGGPGAGVYGTDAGTNNYAGYFEGKIYTDDNLYAIGDVGIGTELPDAKLHIYSSNSYFGMLKLENSNAGDNEASMAFIDGYDATGAEYWLAGVGSWGNTNDFVIGRASPKLLITPTGNVGIGTTEPQEKLTVQGNLAVTGAYKGNIGPNGGAPFPRPAYDSGWVSIGIFETVFTHNIGGNTDNYVVDMQFKDSYWGVHTMGYGGWDPGGHWTNLTNTSITVRRGPDDTVVDQIRIRIWVYN